jgi:soluble lytic murein transglycosylase-like protein
MISDGMLVVQSGHGTLQFPVEEVDGITGLPVVFVPPALPVPRPASSEQASSVDLLVRAALLEGLEPDFVRSVAMVESGLHQEAVSPKGAIGLMQLMPQTAGRLGVDAQQKEQNALGGAAYLRQLLIRYNGNSALALAAYNAGPGAVDKYKGVPPFPETRRYVVKVLEEYARQQKIQSGQSLQAAKPERSSAPEASSLEVMRAETSNPAGERTAVQR